MAADMFRHGNYLKPTAPYPRSFSIPLRYSGLYKAKLTPMFGHRPAARERADINEARLRAKLVASRVKPVKA